jgi:hypothetical protein
MNTYNWHINNITSRDLPNKPGIYILEDKVTGSIYVGASSNVRARISSHRSQLKRGKHPNDKLQKIFNEGILCVNVLLVLPLEDKDKLRDIEKYFYDAIPSLFATDPINIR